MYNKQVDIEKMLKFYKEYKGEIIFLTGFGRAKKHQIRRDIKLDQNQRRRNIQGAATLG